jgi:hypothetical protein
MSQPFFIAFLSDIFSFPITPTGTGVEATYDD